VRAFYDWSCITKISAITTYVHGVIPSKPRDRKISSQGGDMIINFLEAIGCCEFCCAGPPQPKPGPSNPMPS
jgi:hypothetical protein